MKPLYIIASLFALWLLPVVLCAQSFVFPAFKKHINVESELEGAGWEMLDDVNGDLNKDGRADMVAVLEYKDSVREKRGDSIRFHRPRVLLVLFQDTTGSFTVVCQNNTIIARQGEDWMDPEKDPNGGCTIEDGILWVNFNETRLDESYKFRYQKGDFYLIGATSSRWWSNANEEYDVNLSTRQVRHYSWGMDSKKGGHTEWTTLKPGPLIKLQTIKEVSKLHLF
jgi:hypothetical protein